MMLFQRTQHAGSGEFGTRLVVETVGASGLPDGGRVVVSRWDSDNTVELVVDDRRTRVAVWLAGWRPSQLASRLADRLASLRADYPGDPGEAVEFGLGRDARGRSAGLVTVSVAAADGQDDVLGLEVEDDRRTRVAVWLDMDAAEDLVLGLAALSVHL